jgi:hypothetical protein
MALINRVMKTSPKYCCEMLQSVMDDDVGINFDFDEEFSAPEFKFPLDENRRETLTVCPFCGGPVEIRPCDIF